MNQGKVRALPKAVWVTNDKKRDARNLIYEKEASGTKEGTRIAMCIAMFVCTRTQT